MEISLAYKMYVYQVYLHSYDGSNLHLNINIRHSRLVWIEKKCFLQMNSQLQHQKDTEKIKMTAELLAH